MVRNILLCSLRTKTSGWRRTGNNPTFSLQFSYRKNSKTRARMSNKWSRRSGKSNLHLLTPVRKSKSSKSSEKCSVSDSRRLKKLPIRLHLLLRGKEKTRQKRLRSFWRSKAVLSLLNDCWLFWISYNNLTHLNYKMIEQQAKYLSEVELIRYSLKNCNK